MNTKALVRSFALLVFFVVFYIVQPNPLLAESS